jgi:hypothetical protein
LPPPLINGLLGYSALAIFLALYLQDAGRGHFIHNFPTFLSPAVPGLRVPVFSYSRRLNRRYNTHSASWEDKPHFLVKLCISGSLKDGAVFRFVIRATNCIRKNQTAQSAFQIGGRKYKFVSRDNS